jgi:class 3 adenylate cyclase/tetratricopeptide (TPR) repeat protein
MSGGRPLTSYVSALKRRLLAARRDGLSHETRTAGAILFVDVSGFTKLTEHFSAAGPEGAERLAGAFDACFGRMFERIVERGGDVLAFAGDSVLALWPAADGTSPTLAPSVRDAAECGRQLLADFHGLALPEEHTLRLRGALGAGTLHVLEVGGVAGRWECLVLGDALEQARRADKQGTPGELTLSPEARALLARQGAPSGPQQASEADVPSEVLRAHVPAIVMDRETAGHAEWLAEFRTVTVLFARLEDVERLPEGSRLTRLDEAVAAVQSVLKEHSGALHQFLADDSGTRAVAGFGLPAFTHADDAARAVWAAFGMQRRLQALGVPVSVGIATGRIFTGVFGCKDRCEYAIRGLVVNRAARLMAVAHGQILCDETTVDACGTRIGFEPLPPVRLKGFANPVPRYRPVEGASSSSRIEPPASAALVGRAHERGLLESCFKRLQAGRGGLVVVTGEAGIGKTHLLSSVLGEAQADGVRVLRSSGEALEPSTPYFAWRTLLRQALVPDAEPNPENLRKALLARLEHESAMLGWAPVLGAIVPLDLDETEVTSQMDAGARADTTERIVVHLLAAQAALEPTVVFVDDVHWVDSLSSSLLRAVAHGIAALLVVIASRPHDGATSAECGRLLGDAQAETIALGPMTGTEVTELVQRSVGADSLGDGVARLVLDRAEGHPLYTREFVLGLVEAGLLAVEARTCRASPAAEQAATFPQGLAAVITARIDRLSAREQLVIKSASVLGRVFTVEPLCELLADTEARELRPILARLADAGMLHGEGPEGEQVHSFRHITMQNVAYELLPYALRRQLHKRAALSIERAHAHALEPVYALLAHHWAAADEVPEAISYFEKAGEQALGRFSNREAVRFLEAALALAERAPESVAAGRRRRWELMLGEAHVKLAEYEAARAHLEASLQLGGKQRPRGRGWLGADLLRQGALQAMRRQVSGFTGAWSNLDRSGGSPGVASDDPQRESERLTSAAYTHLAEVSLFTHDPVGLVQSTLRALNHGERAGSVREVVFGMGGVSYTASMMGLRRLARDYRDRSLELAESRGNLPTIAYGHQIAATMGNCIGDWEDVDRSCLRSVELFERLGDRFRWQSCQAIHGYMHLARGDFAAARRCLEAAFASAYPDGAPQVQMWACAGALACSLASGTPTDDEIRETERVLVAGVVPAEATLGLGALALAYELKGDLQRALSTADRALAILRSHPPVTSYTQWSIADVADVYVAAFRRAPRELVLRAHAEEVSAILHRAAGAMPVVAPRAHLVAARVARLRDDTTAAMRRCEEAIRAAERLRMPHERALAESEAASMVDAREGRRATTAEARRS